MIPFFSLPGLFTGPIAESVGGADFSFLVGLVLAGGLYFLFSRGLDTAAEEEARQASQLELEGVDAD
jgi:NCS1 family nucleobase:cation symporter-1